MKLFAFEFGAELTHHSQSYLNLFGFTNRDTRFEARISTFMERGETWAGSIATAKMSCWAEYFDGAGMSVECVSRQRESSRRRGRGTTRLWSLPSTTRWLPFTFPVILFFLWWPLETQPIHRIVARKRWNSTTWRPFIRFHCVLMYLMPMVLVCRTGLRLLKWQLLLNKTCVEFTRRLILGNVVKRVKKLRPGRAVRLTFLVAAYHLPFSEPAAQSFTTHMKLWSWNMLKIWRTWKKLKKRECCLENFLLLAFLLILLTCSVLDGFFFIALYFLLHWMLCINVIKTCRNEKNRNFSRHDFFLNPGKSSTE